MESILSTLSVTRGGCLSTKAHYSESFGDATLVAEVGYHQSIMSSAPPVSAAPLSNRLSAAPSAYPVDSVPPGDEDADSHAALHSMVSPSDLSVVFQPIVSMEDGKIFAHEALVRCSIDEWKNPETLFRDAATRECTGLLGRLLREIGVPHGCGRPLFLNVHPQELSQSFLVRPDDPLFLHDDDVYLEVTESVPLSHEALCMSVLREVAGRVGIHVVIDDLGAGYSNLLRIAELEPAIVKLDRALIKDLHLSKRKRVLVSAVIDLCARLDAKVVAEGIEKLEELHILREIGAHYGQGYLLARPGFPPPDIFWPDS